MSSLVFIYIIIISVFTTGQRSTFSKVKFTWKCENNKCIKHLVEYGSREILQTFNVCKLFCGESILWPLPIKSSIEGPPVFISEISFEPEEILESDGNNSPIKHLLEGAKNVFNDRVKKEEAKKWASNYFDEKLKLIIKIKIKDETVDNLSLSTEQEAYNLTVKQSNEDKSLFQITAVIESETFFGARHGLETLSQLIIYDEYNYNLLIPKLINIEDYPKYPYRGIMLDTSRNYFSVNSIKRTIDIMSANKLNSFHWHITDTHSFPIKLEKYPKFAEYGAYSQEKIYTEEDIISIVEYAKIRGVRVIPELDAPAHTGEGWQSVPGTTLCLNKEPWGSYCGEPPCGQLNPLIANVYDTLEGLYREYLRLFQTNIFHMGGDEVSFASWLTSEDIVDWIYSNSTVVNNGTKTPDELDSMSTKLMLYEPSMKEKLIELHSIFQEKALNKLINIDKNKKIDIILWSNELIEIKNINYLKMHNYIIQVWTPANDHNLLNHLLENDFRIILSNSDVLYLDCGFGSWVAGGNNWCSPYKSWHYIYDNKISNIKVKPKKKHLILGQEAPLWSETVSEQSLDSKLWPRGAALAERTWTDPTSNWKQAESRMLNNVERLIKLGADADAIEPEWCNINRNGCSYVIT
ncbi:chitooligosaccharidolytic beta-N-acetylglucosaminidase-like [Lycorma delicatula]|uniref:chitooligosaccharidolytic beta-N-acetylglucosaminidase-like n=1 Tax=Lycorma delicatula TaxID=130591 RepID=UPI003F518597